MGDGPRCRAAWRCSSFNRVVADSGVGGPLGVDHLLGAAGGPAGPRCGSSRWRDRNHEVPLAMLVALCQTCARASRVSPAATVRAVRADRGPVAHPAGDVGRVSGWERIGALGTGATAKGPGGMRAGEPGACREVGVEELGGRTRQAHGAPHRWFLPSAGRGGCARPQSRWTGRSCAPGRSARRAPTPRGRRPQSGETIRCRAPGRVAGTAPRAGAAGHSVQQYVEDAAQGIAGADRGSGWSTPPSRRLGAP